MHQQNQEPPRKKVLHATTLAKHSLTLSLGTLQAWHRTPLRALRPEGMHTTDIPLREMSGGNNSMSPVQLTDIEIEDFGFDDVEIEASQT